MIQVNGSGRRVMNTVCLNAGDRNTAMTSEEHARAYLANRQQDLLERLSSIDNTRRRDPLSQDAEDRAQERENDEVLARLAEVTRAELARVRHAAQRLASGNYGVCESCHKAISESRLRIVPEATHCSHCAPRLQPA